jgi:hypothetical protein
VAVSPASQPTLNRKTRSGYVGRLIGGGMNEDATRKVLIDKAFFVDRSEIEENDYDLSLNRYKEIVYEAIEYDPPLEIIAQLKEMETKIMSDLNDLEGMVKDYYRDHPKQD